MYNKIHICIIMMTLKNKDHIDYYYEYKRALSKSFDKKNVVIHFKRWYDKDIIKYILNNNIKGIILSGSEYRITKNKKYNADLPKKILKLNIPILGICYGYQWIIKNLCGLNCLDYFKSKKNKRVYSKSLITLKPFKIRKIRYRFNHNDYIINIPKNWKISIKKNNIIYMAYDNKNKIIGVQYHPEFYKKSRKIFFRKWIKYIIRDK